MKVYLVIVEGYTPYEDSGFKILAVFSNENKAKERMALEKSKNKNYWLNVIGWHESYSFRIEEFEIEN